MIRKLSVVIVSILFCVPAYAGFLGPDLPNAGDWQIINTKRGATAAIIYRLEVPGGWLIQAYIPHSAVSITFYPDPEHIWIKDEYEKYNKEISNKYVKEL